MEESERERWERVSEALTAQFVAMYAKAWKDYQEAGFDPGELTEEEALRIAHRVLRERVANLN